MSFYKPAHNTAKREKIYEKAKECTANMAKYSKSNLDPLIMQHCVDSATASVQGAYRTTKYNIPWLWVLGGVAALIMAWNWWI